MKLDLKLRTLLGRVLSHQEEDDNFKRLLYFNSAWEAGTYDKEELVWHHGGLWVCTADGTTTEPNRNNAGWQVIAPATAGGAMDLVNPTLTLDPIGAGWTDIDGMDRVFIQPLGITLDPATGTFSFLYPGIYSLQLTLIFSHDENNSGRETGIRLWNDTLGESIGQVPWFIARNQPGTNIVLQFSASVSSATVAGGNVFKFQIGGGDSITPTLVSAESVDIFQTQVEQVT